ncbi:MAG: type I 3-dehydroquinate dehydratase [Kiritimatiellae bacterium]|nr:type I 3-dehydroquinate dehydratase [Kiritimatiellia bacterium]
MQPTVHLGFVKIGPAPSVVGVASRMATLNDIASTVPACDVVEVRRDIIGPEAARWLRATSAHPPILLTVRAEKEGGKWTDSESVRAAEYIALLPYVDAVDVELESDAFPVVTAEAKKMKRTVVGSFHDFKVTPDESRLHELIERGASAGADIVKIAAWTETEADVERLEALLNIHASAPLAVMGMGPLGVASRLRLAASGSCLVYGFLDEESAPGQLSAAELMRRLRR